MMVCRRRSITTLLATIVGSKVMRSLCLSGGSGGGWANAWLVEGGYLCNWLWKSLFSKGVWLINIIEQFYNAELLFHFEIDRQWNKQTNAKISKINLGEVEHTLPHTHICVHLHIRKIYLCNCEHISVKFVYFVNEECSLKKNNSFFIIVPWTNCSTEK